VALGQVIRPAFFRALEIFSCTHGHVAAFVTKRGSAYCAELQGQAFQRYRHIAPFSQISPPAQLRHRRTLVTHRRSHPRWAAARVCFPPRFIYLFIERTWL